MSSALQVVLWREDFEVKNSCLGICQKFYLHTVFTILWPIIFDPCQGLSIDCIYCWIFEAVSPIWLPNSLCACAHGKNWTTVMHLFMVVRLRLEGRHLGWRLNFYYAYVHSKSCHNCNVESDRALCARGWGLPAWSWALHRACGAWEDSRIWGGLRCRRAWTGAPWPHALAACPAPRPWAVNLRPRVHRGGRCWDSHSQVRQGSIHLFCDVFFALLHPQVLFSDCREPCFFRQPSLRQSVHIHKPLQFKGLQQHTLFTEAARREHAQGGLWQPNFQVKRQALETRATIYLERAFVFLSTNLQFSHIPFPVIPFLKPKWRETTHCNASPFPPSSRPALGYRILVS